MKQIAKARQQSPLWNTNTTQYFCCFLQVGKLLKNYIPTIKLSWRRLFRFIFLFKLNKKLKEFDAKAVLFKESIEGDILEIKIGNEFCHTGIAYYSKYFFDYTINQVMMKKLNDDSETGFTRDY